MQMDGASDGNEIMSAIAQLAGEISTLHDVAQHVADPVISSYISQIEAVFRDMVDELILLPSAMYGVKPWRP